MEKTNPEELWKEVISKNKICILATSSLSGKPEAATVEYAEDENFNICFRTSAKHRKYSNLKENPRASVVVNMLPHTLQMDGRVKELHDADAENALGLLIAKMQRPIEKGPQIRLFKFTSSWIRLRIHGTENPYHTIKE